MRAVDGRGGLGVDVTQRKTPRAGQMILAVLLGRQHLDELGTPSHERLELRAIDHMTKRYAGAEPAGSGATGSASAGFACWLRMPTALTIAPARSRPAPMSIAM